MDNAATLHGLVRTRIAEGRLPRWGTNYRLAAKFGDGTACDVCARPVGWSAPMYLLGFRSDKAAREIVMHFPCFVAWVVERAAVRE